MRNEYLNLRRRYEPENIKLIIVAESPPVSGLYFYKPEGRSKTEPLLREMLKQLRLDCTNKADDLLKFQQCGWVLVDATYVPVNELPDPEADSCRRGASICVRRWVVHRRRISSCRP
jgi:hypothetical protein